MKKAMYKLVSVLLSLVLLLSVMPMAALAEEAEHVHTFVPSVGNTEYRYVDDDLHAIIPYTNYDCECGEDSYRVQGTIISYESHKPSPLGIELLGSYVDENGAEVNTYRYTCLKCAAKYIKNEYQ